MSPHVVTLIALAVGMGSALLAWAGMMLPALLCWLGNRVLDGLDGAVARLHGRSTDFGGILDLVTDFIVYASIPAALALRPGADPALAGAAITLLALFYVNAAAWMVPSAVLEARAQRPGGCREPTSVIIPEGLVSGGETVVFYSLFFLFSAHQVVLFRVMAALTAVTVAQRLLWAAREFRPTPGRADGSP